MNLSIGNKLGRYELLSALGRGGMADVYKAYDTRLNRTVAMKVLRPQCCADPRMKERLEREARIVAGLHHPHICVLYDVGNQEGTDYFVMEYVEGETLKQKLARGPLQWRTVVSVAFQIAEALHAAHDKGIIHLDIKPANIIINLLDEVKLLDFGLSKWSFVEEQDNDSTHEKTGALLGTIQYMSPEQAMGKCLDHRTDLFSLGVVLYEMTTGRNPFHRQTVFQTLNAVVSAKPRRIGVLNPEVPGWLIQIIERCIEKQPDMRFSDAAELTRALLYS